MSDLTPPQHPPEDTAVIEAEPPPETRGKRTAIIAAVSLAVVLVLGGGAFAAFKLSGDSSQPEDALPAASLGVISLDLDPSAGQKIEAIKTLRKFPALKKELKVNSGSDLRKYFFDEALKNGDCKKYKYDDVVKPWIGKRVGLAAVKLDKRVAPAIALQVEDAGKAKDGIEKLTKCGKADDDFGYAFGDDYVIMSDSTSHAKAIVSAAKKSSLADDAQYKKWTGDVGDAGVINFYVAADAAAYLSDNIDGLFDEFGPSLPGFPGSDPTPNRVQPPSGLPSGFPTDLPSDFPTDLPSDFPTDLPSDFPTGPLTGSTDVAPSAYHRSAAATVPADDPTDPSQAMKDALKNFKGMAGSVRFADGGMELAVASGGTKQLTDGATIGSRIEKLPSDTTMALGLGVPKDFAKNLIDQVTKTFGEEASRGISDAESMLGVQLPEDLQTLLGKAITISLGGDAPASLSDVSGPGDVPAGISITGDAEGIKRIISKLEAKSGQSLSDADITLDSEGDRVAIGTSDGYVKDLLADGGLGDETNFKAVVPEAGKSTGIFYVNFDSKWRDAIVQLAADEDSQKTAGQVEENLKPLQAFGFSTWTDGSTSHLLLKLTTD